MMKKHFLLLAAILLAGVLSAQNDRATFGLKGNVKKVIQNEDLNHRAYTHNPMESLDLEFDMTGKLVSVGDSVFKKEWREDEQGNKIYEEEFVNVANEYGEYETTYFLKRDGNGRITQVSYWGACDFDPTETFLYDSKGWIVAVKSTGIYIGDDPDVKVEPGYTRIYYDENGNVTKTTPPTTTYTYKQFDKEGNWLVRVAHCPSVHFEDRVEMRTITYW